MAQIYLEIFLDTFKLVIPGCLIILLPFILILLLLLFFRATLRRLMFFFWGVKVKVQRRNLESKRNNRGELQQDESTIAIQEIIKEYQRQKTNQRSRKGGSARKPQQYHAEAEVII